MSRFPLSCTRVNTFHVSAKGITIVAVAALTGAGLTFAVLHGDEARGTGSGQDPAVPQAAETTAVPERGLTATSDPSEPPAPSTVGLSDAELAEFVPALESASPGSTDRITLTMPDGQERRYLYSTPDTVTPEEPLPVLLAMGGWTDPPENFLSYAGFDAAAGHEAVVVYPAGVANAWAGAPYSETTEEEDISFLRAIIAQLETALPVDRERIYAAGMSNGGGMALELACHAPDLVAGVSAVSAALYEEIDDGCQSAPVATQIMHGTEDELLNYNGGILHDTPYLPVVDMVRQLAQRNGCTPDATDSTPVGDNADRLVLWDCTVPTEHIRVNGGFHDWYIDPSTPDEAWAFLSAQRAVRN